MVCSFDKRVLGTAPKLVKLCCMFVEQQFSRQRCVFSCKQAVHFRGDRFRTRKMRECRVVSSGDEVETRRWFSLELIAAEAPYLFKVDGSSQWASALAKLLAVRFALRCRSDMEIWTQAGTDNRSNETLLKKRSTTQWLLLLINTRPSSMHHGSRTLADMQMASS